MEEEEVLEGFGGEKKKERAMGFREKGEQFPNPKN
jgi:hypothetical protein